MVFEKSKGFMNKGSVQGRYGRVSTALLVAEALSFVSAGGEDACSVCVDAALSAVMS